MFKQSEGIGWEISKDGERTIATDNYEYLFDLVRELTNQETAIEVMSWVELAPVGEVYEIRDIVIKVVDILFGGFKC